MALEELTIKEVIRILTEFDIRHTDKIYCNGEEALGITLPSSKLIQLSDKPLIAERRLVIIHELYHAADFIDGGNSSEKNTDKRANQLYKKIYGNYFGK